MNYSEAVRKSLLAFTVGRLTPAIGISTVFVLMAHKSADDLPVFSYVLAAATIISVFFSLILATIGNRAASLAHNLAAQREVFTGGFTLALIIAMITYLACFSATFFISRADGLQGLDKDAYWTLALIYIACTPLLVINTYLQLFLEAIGQASSCARAKTTITLLGCILLTTLVTIISDSNFKYYATSYFLGSELLTSLYLISLTKDQNYYSLNSAKKVWRFFLGTGLPIAAGLSGQKLYFYLLTERLARIDTQLVAQLSVFMTVVGLLIIPSLALSQIHSLEVSRQVKYSSQFYRAGLSWIIGMMILSGTLLYFFASYIFLAVGGSIFDYTMKLYFTLLMFLTCSSLLSLAISHLRARGETFLPQLSTNAIMLLILTPILYGFHYNTADLETFLLLQSAAAGAGFLLLNMRILFVHRRDKKMASVLLAMEQATE